MVSSKSGHGKSRFYCILLEIKTTIEFQNFRVLCIVSVLIRKSFAKRYSIVDRSNCLVCNIYFILRVLFWIPTAVRANDKNQSTQLSSQWRLRKHLNLYFIRPRLCWNEQLLISPPCTISFTFSWMNRGPYRLEITLTLSRTLTMFTPVDHWCPGSDSNHKPHN